MVWLVKVGYLPLQSLLEEQTWVPLSKRCENKCLILFYKIINNLTMVLFWFCNQQDSFTNMIADRSAWSLMSRANLDLNRSSVGLCNFLSKAIPRLIHLGKSDCP